MIYIPIALKLHAFGLTQLQDPNWTGLELYDYIRQHVRGKSEHKKLLQKPLEIGLPYYIGTWLFDEYFHEDRLEQLEGEYQAWHLDDLLSLVAHHNAEAAKYSSFRNASELIKQINSVYKEEPNCEKRTNRLDDITSFVSSYSKVVSNIYEDAETKYYKLINGLAAMGALVSAYARVVSDFKDLLDRIRPEYCMNYADRVVHDRQLCGFISQLILTIGFDGMQDEIEEPTQWVERTAWPERIKEILRARERGACAQCKTNIVTELDKEAHIDHIVPLSRGGTNDIVNLQLLCSSCNLKKYNARVDVNSSIPKYIRENKKA